MSLTQKMQLKPSQSFQVLNAPAELDLDLPAAEGGEAVLLFVRSRAELESLAAPFVEAARADRLAWLAYPKGGQLGTDVNRDILWELTKPMGIRPVRQISIDEVWSALRFRPAQ